MGIVHGYFSWPGVQSVEGGHYVVSHGTSAGVATLAIHPQDINLIQPLGDLVIQDGANDPIVVPGCRVKSVKADRDSGGQIWRVVIEDRRWRWQPPFCHSSLCGNQRDLHNKLLPWTLRSPTEIAEQLLADMGETDWAIDLPAGLGTIDAAGLTDQLQIGENYPPAGKLNSALDLSWDNPAQALSSLCDLYGRRPVYNLGLDRLEIVIPGTGDGLPLDGSFDSQSESVEVPAIPPGIVVVGDRTKFQSRIPVYPYGEEWNGDILPIERLSYAPAVITAKPQITTVSCNGTVAVGQAWSITVEGISVTKVVVLEDLAGIATALAALLNADAEIAVVVTASAAAGIVTLTGKADGVAFDVATYLVNLGEFASMFVTQVQLPAKGTIDSAWENSAPPGFFNVRATDRLTYRQAVELAQKSVWKYFRIGLADPEDPKKPLTDPLGREIIRRQQVILTDTQAEQAVPNSGLAGTVDTHDPKHGPFLADYYSGYSRDLPAMCFGSVANKNNQFMYTARTAGNTPENSRVMVPFQVVPDKQLIVFADPVYKRVGGRIVDPNLVLETGYFLRDAVDNSIERFAASQSFDGSTETTGYATYSRPDIQRNIIALYEATKGGAAGQPQITVVNMTGNVAVGQTWSVIINGVTFSKVVVLEDLAGIATALAALIAANASIAAVVTASAASGILTLTGVKNGVTFTVGTSLNALGEFAAMYNNTTQDAVATAAAVQSNAMTGVKDLEQDPLDRGLFYIEQLKQQYYFKGGGTAVYLSLRPIFLTGLITQVSWEFGPGGCTTTASANAEHESLWRTYPERRRAELLPPVKEAEKVQEKLNPGEMNS